MYTPAVLRQCGFYLLVCKSYSVTFLKLCVGACSRSDFKLRGDQSWVQFGLPSSSLISFPFSSPLLLFRLISPLLNSLPFSLLFSYLCSVRFHSSHIPLSDLICFFIIFRFMLNSMSQGIFFPRSEVLIGGTLTNLAKGSFLSTLSMTYLITFNTEKY